MQNYAMREVGRTLRGHLVWPVAQGDSPTSNWPGLCDSFQNLQGWRFYNLSEQPAPVLHHPQGKKCSFMIRWNSVLHAPVWSCSYQLEAHTQNYWE